MMDTADVAEADNPVLLVHGYMDAVTLPFLNVRAPRWQRLVNGLQDRGYMGPIHDLDLGLPGMTVGSPRRYALAIAETIEELYETYDQPVNVIAHSMGGLGTRWAVEQEGADTYVDTLVTLGSPHQGSPRAVAGMLTPGGRDMIPGSRFLTELNAADPAESVDYVAVYGTADAAFPGRHTERAALPQASDYENMLNIRVTGIGHFDILYDDTVIDAYYDRLIQ